MTASDDFIPGGDPNYDAGPNYPVVFGITITPLIGGVLLALTGLGIATYLLLNFVQPEWDKYQQLDQQVKDKENQVAQQEATLKQAEQVKAELAAAKKQRQDVLALFANESTLDTLLLDINRQIDARNAGLAQARQAKLASCPAWVRSNVKEVEEQVGDLVAKARLKRFEPDVKASGVITDNAFGPQVNNKLKRQVVNVELEGNFNQTQAIMRSIERLQPLLVLRNAEVTLGEAASSNQKLGTIYTAQGNTLRPDPKCQPEPKITSKFQLEALLPLTPEEMAAANPTPPPQQK
jgi:type IV pilus assembly protein PilO